MMRDSPPRFPFRSLTPTVEDIPGRNSTMIPKSCLESEIIKASPVNPFDKSYNYLQRQFDAAVVHLISSTNNFSVSITETPLITNLAAYEAEPNVWVMEQLVNGTSEFSSTTMVLTPGMTYPSDYSFGVGYFRPQLFYKAKSVREEYNIYYIPFTSEVWVCLFGLLLIITVALTFILGRETKLPHDTPYDILARIVDEQHDDGVAWNEVGEIPSKETLLQRERWEIGEILLVAIGALSQQGSARDPSTSAARMLLLVMLLLAAVAYTAYSASVISFVSLLPSAEKEQKTISRSLPKERRLAMQNTNFFKHSFQSEFPRKEVSYGEIERGIDDAINGKTLFVADQDPSLTFLHKKGYSAEERCSLARAFLGIEYQRVFAIRKNSTLKEVINRNLINLQQFGFLSRERKKLFDIRYPCSFKERSSISGFVSFNIDDIKPALYLFGTGLLMSAMLFFLELFTFSSSKIIKRLCYSRWTAHDARIRELTSRFLQSKVKPKTQKETQKRDGLVIPLEEADMKMEPFPFKRYKLLSKPYKNVYGDVLRIESSARSGLQKFVSGNFDVEHDGMGWNAVMEHPRVPPKKGLQYTNF